MRKITFTYQLKSFIASIGWRLFLWGNSKTSEDYWSEIYEQEQAYRKIVNPDSL